MTPDAFIIRSMRSRTGYDGNDHDDYEPCPDRRFLSDQPYLCKYRFQCIYSAGEVYDRCTACLAIQCFGVYQILLKIFTGLNPIRFIKKFFPVMAFAFSTATSNATIPMSIDTLSKKVGVSKKISSFTIPLGATINMDGTSIMQGVAVVFAAQAFGIHLTPMDYVTVIGTATLASVGTAGVPSVGLVTLTMVFNSVGLPVEAIGLIMVLTVSWI